MLLAQQLTLLDTLVILLYLMAVAYLGWLGYRRTQTASDYLIAGRKAHPFIMALSYGATFISTSAIVGFGGVAGMFGMSLLWLTFLNIFVGIFIAFVFLGGRTRDMGHRLQAHTFPEFLGRRFQSRFIQIFAGAIIFVFVPLYAAAVLIGGCEFISQAFNIDYHLAILIFSVIIAAYVVVGGMKGVMYTDALQGSIMVLGMVILLVWTLVMLGGPAKAANELTAMGGGWTKMPDFGWGDNKYNLWWIIVSTIILGVGIGVLAQPQLAVRFMTVKSKRELNRAVLIGGIFICIMTGVPFTVGAFSNLYFKQHEQIVGTIVSETPRTDLIVRIDDKGQPTTQPARLLHIDTNSDGVADVDIIGEGLDGAKLPSAKIIKTLDDGRTVYSADAAAMQRSVVKTGDKWMLNSDSIIPIFYHASHASLVQPRLPADASGRCHEHPLQPVPRPRHRLRSGRNRAPQ